MGRSTARRYQDDYLVWSLFQFETEYLKLRLALERAAGPSVAVDPDQVAQRYEIFVSRLNLVESEHAALVLAHHPDYQRTLARTQDFVRWAERAAAQRRADPRASGAHRRDHRPAGAAGRSDP